MRRALIYLFFDPQGIVDRYVTHTLSDLRKSSEYIFVVSNSKLTSESRTALEAVADDVWERENYGFDVWAYKEAIAKIGMDKLREFDEVILLNYTFFGAIRPFAELFEVTDTWDVDFWGISDHGSTSPHPFRSDLPVMHRHIQSHWIAVRSSLLKSADFAEYWDTMPMITSYVDSVSMHEARFTHHFEKRGYSWKVAYSTTHYDCLHPIFDRAQDTLADGCPILKRRIFFQDPLYLEKEAILGTKILEEVEKSGYPMEYIWENIARSTEPRVLMTNMSMLDIADPHAELTEAASNLRVAVIAHIFYPDAAAEINALLANTPLPFDLYVTTDEESKAAQLRAFFAEYRQGNTEVRVVNSNAGRDISAFLLTCHDVLTSGEYDVVGKIHSKRSPQDGHNHSRLFKDYLFDILFGSRGTVTSILNRFASTPSLGMVFPPVISVGYATMGHSWYANLEPARKLAKRFNLSVTFDKSTPESPNGSMFWVRPNTLSKLTKSDLSWKDFEQEKSYKDGSLPHVLERLVSYAVLSTGHICRETLDHQWAPIFYKFLEYRYQNVASALPPVAMDQLPYLFGLQHGQWKPLLKAQIMSHGPFVTKMARLGYRSARYAYHAGKKVKTTLAPSTEFFRQLFSKGRRA